MTNRAFSVRVKNAIPSNSERRRIMPASICNRGLSLAQQTVDMLGFSALIGR